MDMMEEGRSACADSVPSMLGVRGETIKNKQFLLAKGFAKCLENLFNAETNPNGCINLGTSENRLVFDILKERLNSYNVQWVDDMFTYNKFHGTDNLRKALAEFLTDFSRSPTPIDPEKLLVFNGGGSCMESLTTALCDPGDGVMVPTPYYGGIDFDLTARANAKIIPVHFYSKVEPGQKEPFHPSVAKMESVYQENVKKGVKIRAVLFMNPNNPLGDIFTKQEVLDVVNFCHRHSLHLIMNEVYMNTIFKEGVQHHSVLSLKPEEIPDPQRVHFIWAASKDLAMSGMRFGVIHTWNEDVFQSVYTVSCFQTTPLYTMSIMARFLGDRDWLRNVFFPTNNKRLRESHKVTTDALDAIGVPYLVRPSGLFIYADFRKFMSSVTLESEVDLFYRFIKEGVYIAPSQAFFADEIGWFRIVFSRTIEEMKMGMERISKTCNAMLKENSSAICSDGAMNACGDDTTDKASIQPQGEGTSLESLMSQLKVGIGNSDWLKTNTADQWKTENPQLYKDYMDSFK